MRGLLSLGGHLLIAGFVVFPVLAEPGGLLLGHPDGDVWNHAWGPWWFWHSLSAGSLPWETVLLHGPVGGQLWFIDPVLGLLGAPLVPLLGPALAFDLALYLMIAFASWAVHRFACELGASPRSAWLASAAYVGSAWMLTQVHNGITEAVDIGPVALALAFGERACRERSWGAWAAAGLMVGLSVLASPYLALGAGVALAVRGLAHVRRAWLGALVSLAVGAVPLGLLRAQLGSASAIVRRPKGMDEQLALLHAVDPRTFVWPGLAPVSAAGEVLQHSMYLGLLALLLAGVGLLRGQAHLGWVAGACCALVLSLGPWLYWDGAWVTLSDGSRLALPWMQVQQLAPGLAVTHSLRLAVATLAIVAALAAVGAERLLGRRAVLLLPLLLAETVLIAPAPWPAPVSAAAPPTVHEALDLAEPSASQVVLDLPTDVGATMATSRYLYWQSHHGRPIPYAPDARASTSILVSQSAFRHLASLCRRRPDEHLRLGLPNRSTAASLEILGEYGVRWIVLHPALDPEVSPALQAFLEEELGAGEALGDGLIWDLGPQTQARPARLERMRSSRATADESSVEDLGKKRGRVE